MSSVEELAVRVAIEKEQADRDKLAALIRTAYERYLANTEEADRRDESSPDSRHLRGRAAAYRSVYMHAVELYGHEFVQKLLKDNS